MKKKTVFVLMLIMVMAASLSMTACSKSGGGGSTGEPQTLEEYAVSNPEVQQSIDEATAESDVVVEIKGNDVIYSFELSKMEGYTEDVAKDPNVVEALQTALDNAGPTFGGIAKSLETATGISGIGVIVNYTYDGELIASQTFDSSDAAAEGEAVEPAAEEAEEEAEEAADDAS